MLRCTILLACSSLALFAQGTKSDYERAHSLSKRAANKVFRARIEPRWIGEGDAFWYRVQTGPGKFENIYVDCTTGERRAGYDPGPQAARQLPETRERRRSRDGGGETSLTFVNRADVQVRFLWVGPDGSRKEYGVLSPGEKREQHTYAGHVWVVQGPDGETLATFEAEEGPGEAVIERKRKLTPEQAQAAAIAGRIHSIYFGFGMDEVNGLVEETLRQMRRELAGRRRGGAESPVLSAVSKAEWRPFIREHNIWLRHADTREEVQLTKDGKADDAYSEPLLISPNGTRLAALQAVPEQEHTIYFVESSPKDQLQPKLHKQQYLKPGDRIRRERPRLFDLEKRVPIAVEENLFANPWNISDLRWAADSSQFTFLYNQRGHQVLRIISVDAGTGAASTLVEDRSETFVDYSQKAWHRWLDKTSELLWTSERDGWNHLYLFDARSGTMKAQLTKGNWVVRGVELVDEEKRQVWLRVAGIRASNDPYYVHLARVNFDGSGFTLLSDGDGTRVGTGKMTRSPNGKWIIDTYSRVDLPPVTELRRADTGGLVCTLEKADASALLAEGWTMPERFSAKGRDGETDIYGVIYKPSNFDPAKRYPVIEEIYAGPHGYFVPKDWGTQLRQHALAELGFIVVQIDGMGTNWRSKKFHDVAWRNLKDSGFPDRIAWLKAAASTRPWMDLTNVGIYGGSAGGQSAVAGMLHHGDFYKAAVADCGCHDNRMDKIWWNEAWLGEVGAWYADNSNVTHAAKLQGKLMLVVGELDRNVDPASTMQVANALIKADKDFDLLVMTGAGHGAAESPYGTRRRMDFFVRHLLGVEPRAKP